MFKNNLMRIGIVLSLTVLFISSCRKRDALPPDNYVVFESSSQGVAAAETAVIVKVKTQMGVSGDIPVVINLTEQGVMYGTDYTTMPAASAGKILLTIPSGNNEASFTITKVAGALFDGDEKIVSEIFSSGAPVLIGKTKQFILNFGELVAASAKGESD